jgi:hypothetical protein
VGKPEVEGVDDAGKHPTTNDEIMKKKIVLSSLTMSNISLSFTAAMGTSCGEL